MASLPFKAAYFLLLVVIVIGFAYKALADTLPPGSISTCGSLDSAGTYTLASDIGSGGICLTVTSNGVIINGAGHTVTGNINGDGASETPGYSYTLNNITVTGTVSAEGGADIGNSGGPGYGGSIAINDSTIGNISVNGGATGSFGGASAGSVTIHNSILTGYLIGNGTGNPFGSGGSGALVEISSDSGLDISGLSLSVSGGADFGSGPGVDGTLSLIYTGLVTDGATSFSALSDLSLNGVSQGPFAGGTYNDFPDSAAPSVSLTAPVSSSLVRGSISITATASDNARVLGVQFKVDGSNQGAEDTDGTYGVIWNTTGAADGSHVLSAVARDAAGNHATSTVTVTVDNTAPVVSEVSAIPAGTDTTPDYTFTTNEAGTITYGGSCSSSVTAATSGSNTITLNALAIGTYSDCTITVTDAALNVSNSLALTSFTISAPAAAPAPASAGPTAYSSGGGYSYPSNFPVPVTSHPVASPCSLGDQFDYSTGKACPSQAAAVIALPAGHQGLSFASAFTFLKNVEFKTPLSEDTRQLQIFLNANGFAVSPIGAGSPGKETSYFGPATRAALAQFQAWAGISPAVGYFGPITRAYINGLK